MAEEFETLDMKNENTGEVESFTAADVTARAQIEELNETLTEFPVIDSGIGAIPVDGINTVGSLEIAFNKSFSSNPMVVIAPLSSYPDTVFVSVNGITRTGFTAYGYRTSNGDSVSTRWIAVGT